MPAPYWLLLAALLALFCARRCLRRLLARAFLAGRSRCWRLRVRSDGGLRAWGFRLRLYGVDLDHGSGVGLAIGKRLPACNGRWRVVAIDSDGTAAILLRVDGGNVAEHLLRQGMARVRGSGARRLRKAQRVAQARCRDADDRAQLDARAGIWRPPPFPWWQG